MYLIIEVSYFQTTPVLIVFIFSILFSNSYDDKDDYLCRRKQVWFLIEIKF